MDKSENRFYREAEEAKQAPELEACGWYVRTKRTDVDSAGWLVADCSTSPHGKEYARLFAAAPKLRTVARRALAWIGAVPHGANCFVQDGTCKCGKDAAIKSLDAVLNLAEFVPDEAPEPVRHVTIAGGAR
ncbi:hypothetical protein KDW20_11975 [Burkholderia cenocepacia]|uniref:hypothetical protein n=1 Tax=Burkholderia cenocepacia TaxID=95486 RepID=UPI001B92A539|nr:hypothetical protein [Burkholderia cenocepacia]MBR8376495.1 hypothetical protein [Burkholderia cenocepacia]